MIVMMILVMEEMDEVTCLSDRPSIKKEKMIAFLITCKFVNYYHLK